MCVPRQKDYLVMAKPSAAKKKRPRQLLKTFVALFVVFAMVGIGLGVFLGGQSPKNAGELFEEGQKAVSEGRYADAIELYTEGLALQPDAAEGYNLLGIAYRNEFARTGDAEFQTREIEALRKALELVPDYSEALLNLGQTLVNAGEKQEGAAYLQKFLEIEPDFKDRAAVEQIIQQSGTQ